MFVRVLFWLVRGNPNEDVDSLGVPDDKEACWDEDVESLTVPDDKEACWDEDVESLTVPDDKEACWDEDVEGFQKYLSQFHPEPVATSLTHFKGLYNLLYM